MTIFKQSNRRKCGGFTLLELLIAVSLMGLIFAALTGGLRFGTQAWQSTSERLTESDDMQLVYRTLRRQVSSAINASPSLFPDGRKSSFEGRRDQINFVGAAPTQAMTPGLFHIKFVLVPNEVGQTLALRWDRLQQFPAQEDASNIEPLLRRVQSVGFKYFGIVENDTSPRWVDEWIGFSSLPTMVSIDIKFVDSDRTPWPELIIPIAVGG
jgi:general secretion pathway protein J